MSTVSTVAPAAGMPASQTKVRGSRAVVHSIVSKAVILGLQAGTGILTARALKPAGRGELAAMILWPLFVASVTTLGVPSSLIYFLRRHPDQRDRLGSTGIVMATLLGSLAAVAAAMVLPSWLHQYSPAIIRTAQWFLITVPVCSATLAGRAILEASDEFNASNAIQTLTPFATLIVLVALQLAHCLNPFTAAAAYIAACLPTFWLMVVRVRQAGIRHWGFSPSLVRMMVGYGSRSYGIDVLGTLALQVDQVLVVSLLNPAAMGSYVVVLSLSRMLNLFQNSVVMVLFPKAAGRSKDEVIALTERSARVSFLVTAMCGSCVCIAGPVLLRLLYGREYVSAVSALRVLVLEVLLSGATFVLAQAFMALGSPGIVTILQALGLSLSIPMMLWLIPKYGALGAALSLLVSTVARLLFISVAFPIWLKVRSPRLIPRAEDFQLILQTARGLRQRRPAIS